MATIVSCPQMTELARALMDQDSSFETAQVRWERFKDGFPNLKIENLDRIRDHDVAFLASFDTPGEIFRQMSAIYEIPRYGVRSFKVILPYYPTGTMERVDEDGQIATAATLARMLSYIPMTMSGPAQIIIFDIHALQERFYFSDQVMPRLETAVPLLGKPLEEMEKPIAIAFPDDGALKRFGRMFSNYPLVVCHKVREGDHRGVTIKEGNPRGKHVVIVDDLVMTGGTLVQCREALLQAGAVDVSCYVTHGVFPDDSWKRFCDAGFARFWLTDSCPETVKKLRGREPFHVVSLAPTLADMLLRVV